MRRLVRLRPPGRSDMTCQTCPFGQYTSLKSKLAHSPDSQGFHHGVVRLAISLVEMANC